MYQILHEEIIIAGVFQKGTFIPKVFKWKSRKLPIKEITLISDVKDGGVKKRWFSVVTTDNNLYRLLFDQMNYRWWVEEVWIEE